MKLLLFHLVQAMTNAALIRCAKGIPLGCYAVFQFASYTTVLPTHNVVPTTTKANVNVWKVIPVVPMTEMGVCLLLRMNVIQMLSVLRNKYAINLQENVSQLVITSLVDPRLCVSPRIMCLNVHALQASLLEILMISSRAVKLSVVYQTKTVPHQNSVTDYPSGVWMFVQLILVVKMLYVCLKTSDLNAPVHQTHVQILCLRSNVQ